MTDHAPLTEAELHEDALGSYNDAVRESGARVKAGEIELPEFFRPKYEPSEFWTPERFGQLRGMWIDTKLSAKQIGQILGCSKNSVMGKVDRARKRNELPYREEPAPLIERPVHPLSEVGKRDCRFPIGNPGDEGFHFCRVRVETEGRSYCDEHHTRSVIRKVKAEDIA